MTLCNHHTKYREQEELFFQFFSTVEWLVKINKKNLLGKQTRISYHVTSDQITIQREKHIRFQFDCFVLIISQSIIGKQNI